ncbi:MAG: glycosyl hydrolase [Gemmatimonadota bacterium]|nr:glycosyl hydrolase [Gemmatimonadota bacterium]
MRRRHRLAIALGALLLAVGLVVGLTFLGGRAEGPLEGALRRLGDAVSGLESAVVDAVRGPGRSAELEWFAPYRTDATALVGTDTILLGAYHGEIPGTLEGVLELEAALGVTLPLIHGYFAWGDGAEHAFPETFVEAVADLGSVPVITWEPWLTAFESSLHPELPLRAERDENGLADIATGLYDFYVDAWARRAAEHGEPIFLRFAHEMNDPYRYPWGPQNNEPWEFIEAWNHVVERFRAAGADNVVWVWSPHVAYSGYEWFYPGDGTVDWVATGALNYGTVARWSEWWRFDEIFGNHYDTLAALGKPIMIAEFSTLAVGGDRERWFRQALDGLPERYPAVRSLLFFEVSSDATVTYQELDWSIAGDSTAARTVAGGIAEWEGSPYAPAADPETE